MKRPSINMYGALRGNLEVIPAALLDPGPRLLGVPWPSVFLAVNLVRQASATDQQARTSRWRVSVDAQC
jgi:hypothetical protein